MNLANNDRVKKKITGAGNVRVSVNNQEGGTNINFENVYYVSDLRTNLLSVSKITDHGFEVRFREKDAIVIGQTGEMIFRVERAGNLYYLRQCGNAVIVAETVMQVSHAKSDIDEWHYKLGHVNERDLKNMAKNGVVYGLNLKSDQALSRCEICISEKLTRAPFPQSEGDRTEDLLEIVHSDVCGPMRVASH